MHVKLLTHLTNIVLYWNYCFTSCFVHRWRQKINDLNLYPLITSHLNNILPTLIFYRDILKKKYKQPHSQMYKIHMWCILSILEDVIYSKTLTTQWMHSMAEPCNLKFVQLEYTEFTLMKYRKFNTVYYKMLRVLWSYHINTGKMVPYLLYNINTKL